MHRKHIVGILVSIALAEGVGLLSGLLAGDSGALYRTLELPPASPPGWLFPVAWAILYACMGFAAYLIYAAPRGRDRRRALTIYGVQLALNFLWSIVFFRFEGYVMAIVVIVLLDAMVLWMILDFHRIAKPAAYVLIPYLAWIVFATYLNIGIAVLN